jgi:N-formylglutamate deformylase
VAWRLRHCYDPYHAKVASLIAAARAHNHVAVHINCHSMKSVGNAMNDDAGMSRPDLVVSDWDGTCADPSLTRWVATSLGGLGYRVCINDPYRGGELIRPHADPAQGRHSLQIEINRALYMNERTFERTEGFARLVASLKTFVDQLQHRLDTEPVPRGPQPG